MKKIWVNRARSFEEAQDFDNAYYLRLSRMERVESVQYLREEYFKSHGLNLREDGKRLRIVLYRIEHGFNRHGCLEPSRAGPEQNHPAPGCGSGKFGQYVPDRSCHVRRCQGIS